MNNYGTVSEVPSKENEIVTLAYYQCLCCEHKERLEGKRSDYSEVKVCPKCNGAFVDSFALGKYKKKDTSNSSYVKRIIEQRLEQLNKQIQYTVDDIEGSKEHLEILNNKLSDLNKEVNELTEAIKR